MDPLLLLKITLVKFKGNFEGNKVLTIGRHWFSEMSHYMIFLLFLFQEELSWPWIAYE